MKHLFIVLLLVTWSGLLNSQEFVKVGEAGNRANSSGIGAVEYEFEIARYEVTNEQYCAFLNNVAFKSDFYHLYTPIMSEHFFGGIERYANEERMLYKVKEGYENKPVVGVSWNNAVRYINWLHYNSSNIEEGRNISEFYPYTEGTETGGAYNTIDLADAEKSAITCQKRNVTAIYWLPNRDEWIKAGYYRGDHWEENWIEKGANCYDAAKGWGYPYPHIKNIGYNTEASYYGTHDQQGNAAEWVENVVNNSWRMACGGSVIRTASFALMNAYEGDAPDKSISSFGFRVCRIADKRLRKTQPQLYTTPDSLKKEESLAGDNRDLNQGLYVLCGDPGNEGDRMYQWKGQVDYEFYIGKYELSNEEYVRFLNAVAKFSDPYGLYNPNMGNSVCGGIDRTENELDHSYTYSSKEGWGDKPVSYIGFYDLARYANWLHYGCPSTGNSELGTTEGTLTQGAYNTLDFEEVRTGKKQVYPQFGQRNAGALYWIPNEDEWYKAAYYDPKKLGNRKYHDYPTRTSDPPSHIQANYMIDNTLSVGAPFYVASVTDYANAASYYGTQQQGGNVWEWLEGWQYGVVGERALRGGSWGYTSYGLHACNTDPGGINDESYVFGGRLCRAVDAGGWQEIKAKSNYGTRLYQYFLQISPKKFYMLLGFIILLSIYTAASLVKKGIHLQRKKRRI